MRAKTSILALTVAWLCFSGAAFGGVILSDAWDSDLDGWVITNAPPPGHSASPWGAISQVGSLSGRSGVLQINANSNDPPRQDFIYDTGPIGDIAGTNYVNAGAQALQFDFFSGGAGVPVELDVYFNSDIGGSDVYWRYTVTDMAGGWQTYIANLTVGFGSGWYNMEGRADSFFNTDLTDVDEIGILITYRTDVGGQVYGLDSFSVLDTAFAIPEPETYAVLGFALLSLAITFRRKLEEAFAVVRASRAKV